MMEWAFAQRALDEWTTEVRVVDPSQQIHTWRQVIEAWRDPDFAIDFGEMIATSPSSAVRWECPALTSADLDAPCEFVVLDDPALDRAADKAAFDAHFGPEPTVTFANLGHDAILVVPSDLDQGANYAHLAAFLRTAPLEQRRALWWAVADAIESRLSEKPVFLSTAGGGVPWLHVRLDDRPKYYHHPPYQYGGY